MSRLIIIHNKYSHIARYINPAGKLNNFFVRILYFVDNCIQSITRKKEEELCNLLQQVQHNIQQWNDLVYTSGAKLELSKWFVYIIYF